MKTRDDINVRLISLKSQAALASEGDFKTMLKGQIAALEWTLK